MRRSKVPPLPDAFHEPPVWSPGFSRSGPPEGGTPYLWHDPGGSCSQCAVARARRLSMNLPGHRIAACLGKAALKTHALQTLTRGPLTRPRARSVWSASDLSALSVRRGTASGSISQCMCKNEKGLSMNRSAELQFGKVFCVRRTAIVPNGSSALHPSAYGTDTTGVFPSGPGTCHSVMIFSPSMVFTGYQVSSFNRRTKINDCAAPRLIRLPDEARDSW